MDSAILLKQLANSGQEFRNVPLHDAAKQSGFHLLVRVNQDVPRVNDAPPRDVWMRIPEGHIHLAAASPMMPRLRQTASSTMGVSGQPLPSPAV